MAKHYTYRMDHDTGFAPHTSGGLCTLCGCKTTSVEQWAMAGSWVIGIGGNESGKPDALIYAMQVEEALSLGQFRRQAPKPAAYLRSLDPSSRVLVSRHFYYFGASAVPIPVHLQKLIIRTRGCKKVTDGDVKQLAAFLKRRFAPGVHGVPNNPQGSAAWKCHCGRASKPLQWTALACCR